MKSSQISVLLLSNLPVIGTFDIAASVDAKKDPPHLRTVVSNPMTTGSSISRQKSKPQQDKQAGERQGVMSPAGSAASHESRQRGNPQLHQAYATELRALKTSSRFQHRWVRGGNIMRVDKMLSAASAATPYDQVIPQLRPNLVFPPSRKYWRIPEFSILLTVVDKLVSSISTCTSSAVLP